MSDYVLALIVCGGCTVLSFLMLMRANSVRSDFERKYNTTLQVYRDVTHRCDDVRAHRLAIEAASKVIEVVAAGLPHPKATKAQKSGGIR
jgi:hypothetical protein